MIHRNFSPTYFIVPADSFVTDGNLIIGGANSCSRQYEHSKTA
jgi:hypothetical protein